MGTRMIIRALTLAATLLLCQPPRVLAEEAVMAGKTAAQRRADQFLTKKASFDKLMLPGAAVKLYVRTIGSDSNDGSTPAKAFKTIQKAIGSTKKAGTIIIVGPGSYNEELTFTKATQKGNNGNPNMIVGDIDGKLTGDTAASVTILGTGKNYGVNMSSCDYWQFRLLTFTGQSQMSINATLPTSYTGTPPLITGLVLDGCTFNVPTGYGVYGYYLGDFALTDCDFLRSATSGHCSYLYSYGGNSMKATGNRFLMNSGLYGKSTFKTGNIAAYNSNASYCYGLIAMVGGNAACTLTVQNNIVSDAYIGIYAYAYGGQHTTLVANNTATNCLYATYVYTYNTKACSVSNNINCDSYIGLYMYAPVGKLIGELESGITIATTTTTVAKTGASSSVTNASTVSSYITAASVVGLSVSTAPSFVDTSTGDFSLKSGSVGIDNAYATIVPPTDVYGTARPLGSTASGLTGYDFGAIEADVTALLRVVRWKETSQDE